VVLTVESDLDPGSEIDEIEVGLWMEGALVGTNTLSLSRGDAFPQTLRLSPPSGQRLTVNLVLMARLAGMSVVEARRATSFIDGEETQGPGGIEAGLSLATGGDDFDCTIPPETYRCARITYEVGGAEYSDLLYVTVTSLDQRACADEWQLDYVLSVTVDSEPARLTLVGDWGLII
jgi:hypothetical protein